LEWQKLGLPLVVVAAENVTPDGYPNSRGQIDALQEVLATLSIPLLDLRAPFLAKGSLKEVRWKFDGHWTPTGHKWAAESMFEFLKQKHYFDSPPAVR
jgi:hypothetical protein